MERQGEAARRRMRIMKQPTAGCGSVPGRPLTQGSVHMVRFQRTHSCNGPLRAGAERELQAEGRSWTGATIAPAGPLPPAATNPQLPTYVSPASTRPDGVHDGIHILAGVSGV